jgi:hypothetical protein
MRSEIYSPTEITSDCTDPLMEDPVGQPACGTGFSVNQLLSRHTLWECGVATGAYFIREFQGGRPGYRKRLCGRVGARDLLLD